MSMKGFQWCYSRWAESDAACFCFSLYKPSDYALGPMVIHGTSYIYGYGFPMDLCTSLVETLWHQRRWTWIEGGGRPSVSGRTTHFKWWWAPHKSHQLITPHTSLPHHHHHRQAPYRSLHQMTMHMTHHHDHHSAVSQYCSIAAAYRCGPAALCHRSHPSCSHQALRRPTPSQFLTKFLPLKFLTKISNHLQYNIRPPIASLVFHNCSFPWLGWPQLLTFPKPNRN